MNKIKKSLIVAGLALVAAGALMVNPGAVRKAWASVEGSWIFNQFVLQGPSYIFKSRVGGAQGLIISTAAYSGASQSGVPTGTGNSLWLLGPSTSAGRTSCATAIAGQFIYDTTINSIAFCDGTVWHKLVTGSGANDYWTAY